MKQCSSCHSTYPTTYTHCPHDGSALTDAGEWSVGTLVRGKYQILGKVGQGGMAAVYKALHVRFREPRALKVINPELASDAAFVKRFEHEAVVTRRLQHPNAVRVEDIDEAEDGRPFIIMEFIEGENLKDVIEREAPMPLARVCSIAKQIAAALDAAHALGLVHRDIKPANIALLASSDPTQASGDRVKVLDFGIAKLKEAHLEDSQTHSLAHMTMTGTGMLIGTPAYMSPEQAKGMRGDQLDGRSDLYSLGVVMYQMFTGDLPLKADSTIALLMAHINSEPKPLREACPGLIIPDSVVAVVMGCLEKNRELRPATGQALIEEIDLAMCPPTEQPPVSRVVPEVATPKPVVQPMTAQAMTTQAPVAQPLTAVEPASPKPAQQTRTRSSRSWLWVVIALLTAAALAGTWYVRGRAFPSAQQSAAVVAEPEAPSGAAEPPAPSPGKPTAEIPKLGRRLAPPAAAPEAAPKPEPPITAPVPVDNSPVTVPPPPAPPVPLAQLAIQTAPAVGVAVYLDDQLLGTTENGHLELKDLAPGRHRLRLEEPNSERYEETVNLVAGSNAKLATLVPKPPPAAETTGGSTAAASDDVSENGTSFDVLHYHGGLRFESAEGSLQVFRGGLEFSEHGEHSRPDHDFKVSCAEITEVKANSPAGQRTIVDTFPWFHIRLGSQNYDLLPGPRRKGHYSPDEIAALIAANKARSTTIMTKIQVACRPR